MIRTYINMTVSADQPLRLVCCSGNTSMHWFYLEGDELGLGIFASEGHPEAHRLPAAVAAFNAVMAGEQEVKP